MSAVGRLRNTILKDIFLCDGQISTIFFPLDFLVNGFSSVGPRKMLMERSVMINAVGYQFIRRHQISDSSAANHGKFVLIYARIIAC